MISVGSVSSARSASQSSPVPTVRVGSRGAAVSLLQRELKAAGFNPGPVDGDFGPRTRAAVIALQRARRLTVDGIVGPQTWGSLLNDSHKPGGTGSTGSTGSVGSVPHTGNAFIDSISKGAVAAAKKWGVPSFVTIAQAILESGWGKSSLTTKGFNFFGIKGSGPAGSVTVPTKEYVNGHWITINAAFRKYHNATESFDDHGRLLATSGYYKKAMSVRGSPQAFANALTGVYATAPNYGSTLISLMNQYNLYRFDK